MSAIWRRQVTFKRNLVSGPTAGQLPYGARTESTETVIAGPLKASVQPASSGRITTDRNSPLMSDPPGPIKFAIYLPRGSVQDGDIQVADLAYDDLGRRFIVDAVDYTAIGTKVDTVQSRL